MHTYIHTYTHVHTRFEYAPMMRCEYAALLWVQGLALRASEGAYGIRDLLTLSSVCGIGLDTVPIPGRRPTHDHCRIWNCAHAHRCTAAQTVTYTIKSTAMALICQILTGKVWLTEAHYDESFDWLPVFHNAACISSVRHFIFVNVHGWDLTLCAVLRLQ